MSPLRTAVLSGALSIALSGAAQARDSRIRYVTFNNDNVVTVQAAIGVSTMIQLSPTEVIETISAGDTIGWSIVPKKGSGILFVKPLVEKAETNVNIVTNKRVYSLLLVGSREPSCAPHSMCASTILTKMSTRCCSPRLKKALAIRRLRTSTRRC